MNGVETLKYLQQLPEDSQTKKDVKGIISNFQQLGGKVKKEEVVEEVVEEGKRGCFRRLIGVVLLEDVSTATFDELMLKLITTHGREISWKFR
jgi:hypothetical protein